MYANKDLEQRRNWYSPVAEAYSKARPRYRPDIIHRSVELAQLPSAAKILELGCGTGTATVVFAQLGFSIIGLEPSLKACQLAQKNCAGCPQVEIHNTTFEEWELKTTRFDAVLAANSFHWISPEIAYPKTAQVLGDRGSLILLWNMTPEPQQEVYQVFQEVYKTHAPSIARYEGREIQAEILRGFGQAVIASGRFQELVSEQFPCEATYNADDYLTLLSTFSPYRTLAPQSRDALFTGLREKIEKEFGGSIQLFYLSAFHIASKK